MTTFEKNTSMKNIAFIFATFLFAFSSQAQRSKPPKLIVGIVVDQMCYEYLYRYQANFVEGGFNRFLKKGMNCRNTLYNYVPTYTGPGHASIYTGTTPSNHGIVGNDWYNRETQGNMYCVQDNSVSTVGSSSKEGQMSPENLKTYTITDQLKMTYPKAKVISMSIKDRGSVLPGGHLSDGSYWYDYATGTFITSTYFKKELPTWVSDFNASKNATTYTKTWELLLPKERYSSVDESPYEVVLSGKTSATFPYNFIEMGGGKASPKLFTTSPFANDLLTDFALEAIEKEGLGADNQTDMLCISYSTPDIAGHAFGPYSLELEDIYVRLDRDLKKLMDGLEKKYGKKGFTIFLTADHAVVPVPQMLVDKKMPGGYFYLNQNTEDLRKSTITEFGADLIEYEENLNIYLNHKRIDSLKLNREVVAQFVAAKVRYWKNVKAVFTAGELGQNTSSDNEWKDMLRKGFVYNRSGDVLFILEPGYLPKSKEFEKDHQGTSHGSAFNYDGHVPLLWYGAGIEAKDVFTPYKIIDIAPTLTHLLNLQRSGAMTGQPIIEVLQK